MEGYSGTPLAKKLGIKPGAHVALVHAPRQFERLLDGLPAGVTLQHEPRRGKALFDVILNFTTTQANLPTQFTRIARRLNPHGGGLWIAWPKKASGVSTDLDENIVRHIGLGAGLVDNKVCAIDDTWSGLRIRCANQ